MSQEKKLSFFERYLTLWVLLCIGVGIALGRLAPQVAVTLDSITVYHVSIPIAVCMFFMIYPIMVKIDFSQLIKVSKNPKPIVLSTVIDWLIKPFTKYLLVLFFMGFLFRNLIPGTEILKSGQEIELWRSYSAGLILLSIAPCTAMVFVWNDLAEASIELTLVIVALMSLLILILFAPMATWMLGGVGVVVPWQTMALSMLIYVALPLVAGYLTRKWAIQTKGQEWFETRLLSALSPVSIIALLTTLILLFTFKGEVIVDNPLHILWIAIVLTIQTLLIFVLAYFGLARLFKLPYEKATPVAMIGTSNHFEIAFATAVMLFGLDSGAALAAVVGVLVEVPTMLVLVRIAKKTKHLFPVAPELAPPLTVTEAAGSALAEEVSAE
ncbi:MAG: ACR3 family arsenite efflux transporter [Anaerolineales bacterium]